MSNATTNTPAPPGGKTPRTPEADRRHRARQLLFLAGGLAVGSTALLLALATDEEDDDR